MAATRWVRDQAAALRLDALRLAVGGDSAGGNLAAVVSIDARDRGDLPIKFQLLIYPATDMRRTAPSHAENGQGYLLTHETMDYFTGHYIADSAQLSDWRTSPLLHPDLSNLPAALLLTAGFDPLRDEGAAQNTVQFSAQSFDAGPTWLVEKMRAKFHCNAFYLLKCITQ